MMKSVTNAQARLIGRWGDSLTGQGVFNYVGNMQDEYAVGLLAGAVDSTLEGCGLLA